MFKRYGKCMALCLCFLLVGILIGGCIEAASPRPNHIHMQVMSYGEVNVTPEVGDIIDWTPHDTSQSLTIHFSQFLGAPCDEGNDSNTCTFNTLKGAYIFPYTCNGQANCPDPGVGPPGRQTFFGFRKPGAFSNFVSKLVKFFDRFVLKIDHLLVLAPTPVYAKGSPPLSAQNPHTAAGQAPTNPGSLPAQPIARVGPYGVTCDGGNNTVVEQQTISAKSGDMIIWVSSNHTFSLAMQNPICQQSTSTADISQQCTLTNVISGNTYSYTATANSCTTSINYNISVQ
jgi:plastocyanin